MAITEQLRSVARFEYALVRSALTTVDRTILTPLADRSPGVERVVTRARDAVADLSGRLGAATQEALAGPVRTEPSEPSARPRPARAADKFADKVADKVEGIESSLSDVLEQPVAAADEADGATAAAEPASDEGSAVLTGTEVQEAKVLAEDILETEHVTGELAENVDLREVQARLRAKHALQEQDEQHR